MTIAARSKFDRRPSTRLPRRARPMLSPTDQTTSPAAAANAAARASADVGLVAGAATIGRATLRWLNARREEIGLTLLWPGTPAPFHRHLAFRRLSIYIFLYNLIVMWVTIHLTANLVTTLVRLFPAGAIQNYQQDVRIQSIRWAEGLLRYMLWTALNFPLALKFRRLWYDDLLMSGQLPGVSPAVMFGRPIFWATFIATMFAAETIGNPSVRQLGINQPFLVQWMQGNLGIADFNLVVDRLREILHTVAVGIFRAAAVTYALFAGMKVRGAVARIVAVYCIGGLLLFVTHAHGERLSNQRMPDEWNKIYQQQNVQNHAQRRFTETVRRSLLPTLARLTDNRIVYTKVRPIVERGLAAAEEQRQLQFATLRSSHRAWREMWELKFFIPYYLVALGGASFLLMMTRARTRYGDE